MSKRAAEDSAAAAGPEVSSKFNLPTGPSALSKVDEELHGSWDSGKGKCKVGKDPITARLTYEEPLEDGVVEKLKGMERLSELEGVEKFYTEVSAAQKREVKDEDIFADQRTIAQLKRTRLTVAINAFKLSHRVLDNALFVVVGFQLAFQLVFYMGLASALAHWTVLPYILGVWLLYVGYHAAFDDDHADFNVMESRIVRGARWLLGSRLLTAHEADSFVTVGPRGKYCLTVGGLCVAFLVVADFLLEIDVTLAKIEGLGGAKIGPELEYICFSSSAVATFTVPELYFVARDIFARLRGLKYGIALVIVYLGVQMLLGTVYTVPLLVDVAIFIGVLILSCVTSVIVDNIQAMSSASGLQQKAGSIKNFDDPGGERSARRTWNGVCANVRQEVDVRSAPPPPEATPEATPEETPEASSAPAAEQDSVTPTTPVAVASAAAA